MDIETLDEERSDIILRILETADKRSTAALDEIRGGNFGDFLETVKWLHIKANDTAEICARMSTATNAQRCNISAMSRFDSYNERFVKELMDMCM